MHAQPQGHLPGAVKIPSKDDVRVQSLHPLPLRAAEKAPFELGFRGERPGGKAVTAPQGVFPAFLQGLRHVSVVNIIAAYGRALGLHLVNGAFQACGQCTVCVPGLVSGRVYVRWQMRLNLVQDGIYIQIVRCVISTLYQLGFAKLMRPVQCPHGIVPCGVCVHAEGSGPSFYVITSDIDIGSDVVLCAGIPHPGKVEVRETIFDGVAVHGQEAPVQEIHEGPPGRQPYAAFWPYRCRKGALGGQKSQLELS